MSTANPPPIEGYWDVVPRIDNIAFPNENRMEIKLEDGRVIACPLTHFPSIQRLTSEQRQAWYRFGNGFSFDDSDEVIHIEQILGNFQAYATKMNSVMVATEQIKSRLHRLIDEENDPAVLELVDSVLSRPSAQGTGNDEWNAEDRAALEEGLADIRAGRMTPWEEVKKRYL